MNEKHTTISTPAERAAMLPAPVPGEVITVPLPLLPAYLDLHKLEPCGKQADVLVCEQHKSEGS